MLDANVFASQIAPCIHPLVGQCSLMIVHIVIVLSRNGKRQDLGYRAPGTEANGGFD